MNSQLGSHCEIIYCNIIIATLCVWTHTSQMAMQCMWKFNLLIVLLIQCNDASLNIFDHDCFPTWSTVTVVLNPDFPGWRAVCIRDSYNSCSHLIWGYLYFLQLLTQLLTQWPTQWLMQYIEPPNHWDQGVRIPMEGLWVDGVEGPVFHTILHIARLTSVSFVSG